MLAYGAVFALLIVFWLLSVLLLIVVVEENDELFVSKEVLLGDFCGDFDKVRGFRGCCFCSRFVGDFVGLLAPFLETLPEFTSTLNCGGGAPFAAPAWSKRLAMFRTEPTGRAPSAEVDLALLRVCTCADGGLTAMGGCLRLGDCDAALGASARGGCRRCWGGGLAKEAGGGVGELREKRASSPVRSRRVAEVNGGLMRPSWSGAAEAYWRGIVTDGSSRPGFRGACWACGSQGRNASRRGCVSSVVASMDVSRCVRACVVAAVVVLPTQTRLRASAAAASVRESAGQTSRARED